MPQTFTCTSCKEIHGLKEISFAADLPDPIYFMPEEERAANCTCTANFCTQNAYGEHNFYVRGCIEIPIIGEQNPFVWGVWTSLSEQNYNRIVSLHNVQGRENEPPYFGWLMTNLPLYPRTIELKTLVHTREAGMSPYIELEPTDHPLAVEQHNGITMERAQVIIETLLHGKAS